jgi:putative ABC transport system permease protein
MLRYYLRLALKSFARNPGISAVMVGAIAVGIAACIVSFTVYHAMSGNPLWWKDDKLYAVGIDSGDPAQPMNFRHPAYPPEQLTYRDATYLAHSGIPERHALLYRQNGVVVGGSAARAPLPIITLATTADFFSMFEVPFHFGGPWTRSADTSAEPVVVLSRALNDKLFGGENSVGRTLRWNDVELRIVGVLDNWYPVPKFYALQEGAFEPPEDAFVPFSLPTAREIRPDGGFLQCWKAPDGPTMGAFLNSECSWVYLWLELRDAASRERMQSLLDSYWDEQHKAGRFLRPRNNRLTRISDYLQQEEAVPNDNRVLVALAFAFLAVCLINTAGLLLAKFLGRASISGIRRALGATRGDLMAQHLCEAGLLATAASLLGLILGAVGLWTVRVAYSVGTLPAGMTTGGYQELAHFDPASIAWALALAGVSALAAGLYPAWRIGRLMPAPYLKTQ